MKMIGVSFSYEEITDIGGTFLELGQVRTPHAREKVYSYLVSDADAETIKVGDLVVVAVGAKNQMRLTKVTKGPELASDRATKWIVQRVDVSAWQERQVREEQRQAIVSQLRRIQREQSEVDQFAALADKSPEAKELLRLLNDL